MSNENKKKAESERPKGGLIEKPKLRAKRAFMIQRNEYLREITEGDDLSDVPEIYHPNLKTEGVI